MFTLQAIQAFCYSILSYLNLLLILTFLPDPFTSPLYLIIYNKKAFIYMNDVDNDLIYSILQMF